MASSSLSISIVFFSFFVSLIVICFSNKRVYASSVCGSSIQGKLIDGPSMKVFHRHGPCSHSTLDKSKTPSTAEFLTQDQSRVDSIQARLTTNSNKNTLKTSKTTLPAKPGALLGTGNYFVVVGLGTPKTQLSLAFDTGSNIMWTQCQPCLGSCYKQKDPIFNPSASTTYRNVTCTDPQCVQLASATEIEPACIDTTCVYGAAYGDNSFSEGFFSKETLYLTETEVFPDFFFGCGQNNGGLFEGTAGLLGLGRDELSLVSQTAAKYNKYFSYCLPTVRSTGYLTFGTSGSSNAMTFTPLLTNSNSHSFYFIDIVSIKCGSVILPIPQTIFKTAGTIIDSGTVITRLPATAYSALRTEFRKQMAKYPSAPALSILDTCYDFSNYTTATLPTININFGGNAQVPIDAQGILYNGGYKSQACAATAGNTDDSQVCLAFDGNTDKSQVCLAFAGNTDDSKVAIFGNVQQQTLNVAYDVAGGKLGFGLNGCS